MRGNVFDNFLAKLKSKLIFLETLRASISQNNMQWPYEHDPIRFKSFLVGYQMEHLDLHSSNWSS